ncbi:hypothetical protein [Streptomonospora salina]|uniref:Uncharacterized protein n=1 Tax=Streptomonospora salina TaxID=104205 RepID=A0A841ECJ4_9ACTN|nr:hypothetical protein [Streptomonospora salina]MBB6000114.1 hypothetical protein [Streptomonospora salina]
MLDPHAPAATGQPGLDAGRVPVEQPQIAEFVLDRGYLSAPSACAFAEWLRSVWNDFLEGDGSYTNGQVIYAALVDWCGGADPTRCLHGSRMGQTCPDCDAPA